jgi:peptide/nickel transport system permease protein
MQTFIIRRLLSGLLILFILSVTVFVLLRVVPGDPAIRICGLNCTKPQIEEIHHQMGLDKSYPQQYWDWMGGVLTGDLGTSNVNHKPVWPQIRHRFPVTFEIMVLTMIMTILLGVPLGIISAVSRNSSGDYAVRSGAVLGLAVPSFWVATLVLILPVAWWGYAPTIGRAIPFTEDPVGNMQQYLPAAAVLALASAAGIMRLTRSSLLEVMRQDYMRTARAKGLKERAVIIRHGLKNSLIPVVTVLGLQISGLIGGAIIVEQIFTLPGEGQFTFVALFNKDYDVVMAMTLYAGVAVILINLMVDICYAWLDPRIRYS